MTDSESLKSFFVLPEGCEGIVLHLGSLVTSNPDYSQKVIDVNVGGTRNIIDFCLATPRNNEAGVLLQHGSHSGAA